MSDLPDFRLHPDPLATGSIRKSDRECICCERRRGFIYVGPIYAQDELDEAICPWCISDGSAHDKFDASFMDEDGIGGYGAWDKVPDNVISEVAYRTPGFSGWQQEKWWTHCGDAAAFLGAAGYAEISAHGPDAAVSIRQDAGLEGAKWESHLGLLSKDGSPTAYLFKCTHCGAVGGYQDSH